MNKSVNLEKLRGEIDSRKKEKYIVSDKYNERTGGTAPRDAFLNGLLESLQTGRATASSVLVKSVENKVAIKNGEARLPIPSHVPTAQPSAPQRLHEMDVSPERDEQLYVDLERKRKQTLAESIGEYTGKKSTNDNSNTYPQQGNINEGYLVENVKKIVNGYLVENFGPIVEEAIKSTILEMYAADKIKEVLQENKDLIKTIVLETIREIQAKNKQKS